VEVRDSEGTRLAGDAAAFRDSAEALFEFILDPGEERAILGLAEAEADGDRGAVYFGQTVGITVERGVVHEAIVRLDPVVPEAPEILGSPGEPSYLVRWDAVGYAEGYLLRESSPEGTIDYPVAGTSRTFDPLEARGTARLTPSGARRSGRDLAAQRRTYRVQADLPFGHGVFGDSAGVDLDQWFDLPHVVEVTPADSAEGVSDLAIVRLRFDRGIDPSSVSDTLLTLRELPGGAVLPVTRIPLDPATIDLQAASPLERGAWYRVRVSTRVKDATGRPFDQDPGRAGLQAFVSDFRVETYDPLRVLEVVPADGTIGVLPETQVRITFDRPVVPATVTASTITLTDSGGVVPATVRLQEGGTVAELRPSRRLAFGLEHELRVETTVHDAARDEPLDQDPAEPGLQPFRASFRAMAQPRGPRVAASVPAPGEPHHPVQAPLTITFDRPVDPASVVLGRALLIQVNLFGTYFNLPGGLAFSADSLMGTFTPTRALDRDGVYRLVAVGGYDGILDPHGIPFDQDPLLPGFQAYPVDFRAEQNVRVSAVTPALGAEGVAWNAAVEVTFSMPVRPGSVVDTTFTLTQAGAPIAGTISVAADSLRAVLTPLAPLQSYRTYEVAVGTGVRSRRDGPFDQDWNQPGHQKFRSSFRTMPETEAPRVVSVEPADLTRDVPLDAGVRVVFSEPVRPIRVLDYYWVTRGDSLGGRVDGTITVSQDSLSAVFRPLAALDFGTDYHVHVDTWVTDPFGNRLDQDPLKPDWQKFHSVFTTEGERVPPRVTTVDPPDSAQDVALAAEIVVSFSESMDRASVGSAFQLTEEAGPSVDGVLAFFDADRRIVFTPSVPLDLDRRYRVQVDTIAADLAGNPLDQDPESPDPDPFESTFRTVGDTEAPSVVSVAPPDSAEGVSIDVDASVVMSEPIDPSSVTAGSVLLQDSLGTGVAATRQVSGDFLSVTIRPSAPLEFAALYRIVVTPDVTDTSGNSLDQEPGTPEDQPFASYFRTEQETIPPRVSAWLLDGPPPPPVTTRVRVVFTEPVDPASVDSASFRLFSASGDVAGVRTVSAEADTATLSPSTPLSYLTAYTVRVEGVRDRAGNRLDQDPAAPGEQAFTAQFETGFDNVPPFVSRSEPEDGELGVDPSDDFRLAFSEAMNTGTFSGPDPGLFLDGVPVPGQRLAQPGDSVFVFLPDPPLERGRVYEWRAGPLLADLAGNLLDQDPDVPEGQGFTAQFEVGDRPLADAGPAFCSVGPDPQTSFNATGSDDPDGAIVRAIWDWGDGTVDTLAAPEGLQAIHVYPCADDAGCDVADNDGDGVVDETGPSGCDESYRVLLIVEDDHGLRSSADTTGVSFCVFRAIASDPADGATGVDTLAVVRVDLTRAVNPSTLDESSVYIALDDAAVVPAGLTTEEGGRRILLSPAAPLLADRDYVLHVRPALRALDGEALDQDPCIAGGQELRVAFHTLPPPLSRR
jgi:hypothetical protein